MKKLENNGRKPGQTQITISLSESLVNKIDKIAKKQKRNRSNMIAFVLESYKG